jgi:hypothetical protein
MEETAKINDERIRTRYEREEERYRHHDEKAKSHRKKMDELLAMDRERRFSEAEHVIEATGFTLEEIIAAARERNFFGLQKKANAILEGGAAAKAGGGLEAGFFDGLDDVELEELEEVEELEEPEETGGNAAAAAERSGEHGVY